MRRLPIKRLIQILQPRHWIYYGVLFAIVIALVSFLRDADLPWKKGVEAKLAKGEKPGTQHYVVSGLYYGAWINLGICGLLALLGYWALKPLTRAPEQPAETSHRRRRPSMLILAVLASGATLWLLVSTFSARMGQSLWGDEEYTMKRFTVGDFERDEEDNLRFKPMKWRDTLFWYKNPNNHVLYSVLARVSHESFGPAPADKDPEQFHFSERALRIPAMIAGAGSLGTLAWLLVLLGYRRAAWIVPLLLVLHPWFVRYTVEARGYSLVLLLVPLSLCMAIRVLRSGSWPWWSGYAAVQFLLFYSHPATLYFLLCLNGAVGGAIWFRGGHDRWHRIVRWVTACFFSALPVVFLMAPLKIPLEKYLERGRAKGEMKMEWYQDIGSYLTTGTPWNDWEADNPLSIGLEEASPWLVWSLMLLFALLLALGTWHLYRRGGWRRWLLAPLWGPPIAMLLAALAAGNYLYPWYMVIYLPGLFVLLGAGLEAIPKPTGRWRSAPLLGGAVALVVLLLFVAGPQRRILLEHATEPLAEAVRSTRLVVNPHSTRIDESITVGFHMAATGYDPAIRMLEENRTDPMAPVAELERWLEEADASDRPLAVHFAQYREARKRFPEVIRHLEESGRYHAPMVFHGQDTQLTRLVFKYRGSP